MSECNINTQTDDWEINNVTFKPLPGCAINQTPVQLLLKLINEHNIMASNVESIDLYLAPRDANYPGTKEYGPFQSRSGAIMSAPFMLSVAVHNKTIINQDYDSFDENPLHDYSQRIHVHEENNLAEDNDIMEIHLKDKTIRGEYKREHDFIFSWADTVVMVKQLFQESQSEKILRGTDKVTEYIEQLPSDDHLTKKITSLLTFS